ncbi:MAG TPA: PDZ domain-containing protein, partial [Isosphaeraceae bacterium]|nr:PDZ domain-containing protein [Isosphaeraceae bacterium]
EDPFQLEGMNALGLPGATIDGILGFTILARFRMEFDPTRDWMTWTRLNYEPKEPFVPRNAAERQAPAEVQAMNLLGPAMKLMAVFVGKQPEDILHPQGLLGLELTEAKDGTTKVARVLPGTPADEAGVKPGDVLVELHDRSIENLDSAHSAIARIRPGDKVTLTLKRGETTLERTLTAAEGF